MMSEYGQVLTMRSLQAKVAGKIQFGDEDSPIHDVLKFNGDQYRILEALEKSGAGWRDVVGFYDLAAEVVPSANGEIRKLNQDELKALIAMASGGIDAVKALFPNAVSPESKSSTSPG